MGNKKNKRKRDFDFNGENKENLKLSSKGSWYKQNEYSEEHSASFTKIKTEQLLSEINVNREDYENIIVNLQEMNKMLGFHAICADCKKGKLVFKTKGESRSGVVPTLQMHCSNGKCSKTLSRNVDIQPQTGRVYGINKKLVLGARAAGIGRRGIQKMFAFMGMPQPTHASNWRNHQVQLANELDEVAKDNMEEAVRELRQKVQDSDGVECIDSVLDVAVTFDGSWNHVGYSGSFCIVYAIAIDTGKIIDYETRYKMCKVCVANEDKKGKPEFSEWLEAHKATCTKTHEGSSSSMESECILELYKRSVDKHSLRYTTFIGDGDSSAYRSVVKANVYGENVHITKENCVGHIQKRMGTRLRSLLTENKGQKLSDGKSLSGRGRLTHKVIDSFQVFYGIALRTNKGNLSQMQQATQAILCHYSSTPDKPNHDNCPKGEDSWCKYQSDLVTGQVTYRYPKYPLPEAVVEKLTPLFLELSSEKLLKTCLKGLTQNANESLHSMLWKLVSKKQYQGESAYRLAAALVCGYWNSGQLNFNMKVCDKLGFVNQCQSSLNTWSSLDAIRVRDAEYQISEKRKKRRKELRKEKLRKEDAFQKLDYISGQFVLDSSSLQSVKTVRRCKLCRNPMKGHKKSDCKNV